MTDAEREAQIRERAPEAWDDNNLEKQLTIARLDRVDLLRLLDEARAATVNREIMTIATIEQSCAKLALQEAEIARLTAQVNKDKDGITELRAPLKNANEKIARMPTRRFPD